MKSLELDPKRTAVLLCRDKASGRAIGTVRDLLVDRKAGEVVLLDLDLAGGDRRGRAPIRAVQIDRKARVVRMDSSDLLDGAALSPMADRDDARAAFEPLTPVHFTLDRLETNPRFAAIARPAAPPQPASSSSDILGDYWPGIQIYYPPVKYAPSLGIYETMEQAAERFPGPSEGRQVAAYEGRVGAPHPPARAAVQPGHRRLPVLELPGDREQLTWRAAGHRHTEDTVAQRRQGAPDEGAAPRLVRRAAAPRLRSPAPRRRGAVPWRGP